MAERISPRDLTVTRMDVTETRLRRYWAANRRLPADLADLPNLKGRDNATSDGWGRPIKYQVAGPTTVTLSSAGADATADSTGSSEAIVVAFDVSKD